MRDKKWGINLEYFSRFLQDESGATAIEYVFIATLLGISIISGFSNFTNSFSNTINYAQSTLKSFSENNS